MFKAKKKPLIIVSSIFVFVLIIALLLPPLRTPALIILKFPLKLFALIEREYQGIVFYHRNFIRNDILTKENDYLKNKLNALEELSLENQRLKNLLSFKQNSLNKLIAANVIARSADSWTSNIIIDKGRSNGIRQGMAVVTYLGLVGRVIETQAFTSKILLISDPNLSVSAIVQRSRQEGLVCGTLGSNLIMKYLPEDADINIQDKVITSGLNEVYLRA